MMKKIFTTYLPITITLFLAVIFVFVLTYGFTTEKKVDAAWYSSGGTWGYRKMITIDRTKVATSTSLTNFPMLFSVVDPELKLVANGGKVASSTGKDILFTSSDGTTKLDYEIERYSSTTGEVIMWVKIPTLSATVDTVIYVYFGNAGASDQTNTTGTWNSDFKGVYHLPDATTLTANDSTSNAKNGTLVGSPQAITGQVGGAASTTASNTQYISSDTTISAAGDYTISAWVYLRTTSLYGTVARAGSDDFFAVVTGPHLAIDFGRVSNAGNPSLFGSTYVPTFTWFYATIVCRNSVRFVYFNGVQDGTGGSCGGSVPPVNNGSIAAAYTTNGNTYTSLLSGSVDEVHFLNTGLTAEWIKTEYNNQSNPSAFYAYGAVGVETRNSSSVGIRGASGNPASPAVKFRGGIKIR